jgi:membrane protease YdiL (CAAX protease family)
MPTLADHAVAFLLVAILPVYAAFEYRRLVRAVRAGVSGARARAYRDTILLQWALTGLTLALWFLARRPATMIGLAVPFDARSLAGAFVTAAGLSLLYWQWRAVVRLDGAGREALRAQVAAVADLVPRSPREAALFRALAVTAGICEEVLYRGFLIWYLAAYVGSWPGALVAGVAFGVAHFYQGLGGVVKTGVVGLLTALLYVATDSLLWPVALHAAIDLQGGAVGCHLLEGTSPDPRHEAGDA